MVRRTLLAAILSLMTTVSVVAAPVDTLLTNGRIYTVDGDRTWAEAVAIADGRIVYVGSNSAAQELAGATTRRVDLQGRMVLPSFQDVHIHPVSGGLNYTACSLFETSSLEDVKQAVSACVSEKPYAQVIRGAGWDWRSFEEGQRPTRFQLDKVESRRPVVLVDSLGHTLWLNSAALDYAGISAASPDPEGGRIGRLDDSREPDGTLHEGPAWDLVNDKLPPISNEERREGLRYAQKHLNALGVTTIQDAYVRLSGTEPDKSLPVYASMRDAGELSLRVSAALYWDPALGVEQLSAMGEARERYSAGRLVVNTVKIWADGVIEAYTAKMLEPYSDKPDDSGLLMVPREMIMQAVPLLDAQGYQVHIHAIGDATVRYSLDAFELARKTIGQRDSRHLTAHTQMVNPADVNRFADLDVIAGFTPYWFKADKYITEINPPQLGEQRMGQMYPVNSILKSGGRVAFGSDWSVSTADPLLGIETAVTHLDPEGESTPEFMPGERISLAQAIAAYTIDAAYANFLDKDTGSIEVGKYADLIVLSDNLFELAPEHISEVRVEVTLLEGEVVYGSF